MQYCIAQENLIPNWSFEELRPNLNGDTLCPANGGSIYLSAHWSNAYGSVDYFNSCSNDTFPKYGVPQNGKGWQEGFEGEAYASIAGYIEIYNNIREYLWMELPEPLKPEQGYYWEAQVSLADSMNFAISRIGALFTVENTRYWSKYDFFNVEPQVENPYENLLDDKENWTTISGRFIAEGGEKFMTIGSFRTDAEENIQRVSNYPYVIYSWEASSYYVDAVVLREDNTIGIAENAAVRTTLYPNPSAPGGENVVLEYAAKNGSHLQWEITDMVGRRVLVQPLQGMEGRAVLGTQLTAGVYISSVVVDGARGAGQRLVIQ